MDPIQHHLKMVVAIHYILSPPSSIMQTSIADHSMNKHPKWTFLTNHFHVLIQLHSNPSLVLKEVAQHIGITERAVQRIIVDLEKGGVIERQRIGRQNRYRINLDQPLRHPLEAKHTIGELLNLIIADSQDLKSQ